MNSSQSQEVLSSQGSKYLEITKYFLRLGMTGFGGPLALIADMQKELVEERKWVSIDEFRQVFPLIKSMPGPVAFQVAMYLGYRRSDRIGATLAGVMLLLPATILMIVLAASYEVFKSSQALTALMNGFQMGALVLIFLALKSLTEGLLKKKTFWFFALLSFVLLWKDWLSEPVVILGSGALAIFGNWHPKSTRVREAFSLGLMIWFCLQAGAVVFGTGIAILPLLERDFVQDTGWVTHSLFMDGLAFGQLTPGPISVTVTFLGYYLDGVRGALAATVAIFLPSAFHQLTWFPRFVGWMSKQTWIQPFLVGAMSAIAAGILVAVIRIGAEANTNQMIVFAVCLLVCVLKKVPSWSVILGSGLLSYLLFLF